MPTACRTRQQASPRICVVNAQKQKPRRGAGAPAAFSGQSVTRYFRENLKFATGLVGVVYVSGRASVIVLHEFWSALLVFQLYW
jgi:hypothetical protein